MARWRAVGWWRLAGGIAALVAFLVVAARIWSFASGHQFGASAEWAWNLLVAASIGLVVLTWYQAYAVGRRAARKQVEAGSVVAAASAALAFAAAAVGSV